MSASPVPSAEKYANAILRLRRGKQLSHDVQLMLIFHAQKSDHVATYSQLAQAAGYGGYEEANLRYGTFGRKLGETLGMAFLPSKSRPGEPFYSSSIGSGHEGGSPKEFRLHMHAELVEAIDKLGWTKSAALQALRPTVKQAIIDLLVDAHIDVEPWSYTSSGARVAKPRSNPDFCYEWSFGSADEGYIICVWHQLIREQGSQIFYDVNMLELIRERQTAALNKKLSGGQKAKARTQARRAKAFLDVCDHAYRKGCALRVIIGEGDLRSAEDFEEKSSEVDYRLLDAENWYVHRFDLSTGDCLLVRTFLPESSPLTLEVDAAPSTSDPSNADDTRRLAEILTRRGQTKFRENLLAAYGRQCAVTGTKIVELLEAAHITPHAEGADYAVRNGLLLRADIHTLYDLHLLSIDEYMVVRLSQILKNTDYWKFDGATLRKLPESFKDQPWQASLQSRHARFLAKEQSRL